MTEEQKAEQSVEYIRTHAAKTAEATAIRAHLAEYRKSLKAILMADKLNETNAAQERYAYSHAKYLEHLEALKIAIYEDERLQWLMKAADREIGLYQTKVKSKL